MAMLRWVVIATAMQTVGSWHVAAPRVMVPLVASRATVARAMFSGIVEEMGKVRSLEKVARLEQWDGTVGEGWELEVEASVALEQASLGCSIAVNGVCLTVTEWDDKSFRVGLAPETIRRTNLEKLKSGDPVNLERALPADGRNSGHFVQGHVDNVGIIEELRPDGDSLFVRVKPPAELMPYIVPKGFIAIDGTSLTVCDVNQAEGWFEFMLIEFTQQKVIIAKKAVGDAVNIEVDVLAKYVEQGLKAVTARLDALEAKLAA
eukprot:CAMPEP_0115865266 /NCGR_PEP_ID=MMETSP0287-20121206/19633_1 /TAXON_ID=412157 /ORGANISM="Chrysochromulina rotalis, Strain UIO044" /LENGTH=261 /DNA_ID=CAMNT_0003319773 /DNA_START=19 /DNA_END=804 /DNA_ORIENTATION=+